MYVLSALAKNNICDTATSSAALASEKSRSYLFKYFVDINCYTHPYDKSNRMKISITPNPEKCEEYNLDRIKEKSKDAIEYERNYEISILSFILREISFEAKVYCDNDGYFINYGYENGVPIDIIYGAIDSAKCCLSIKKTGEKIPFAELKKPDRTCTSFISDSSITNKYKNETLVINYNAANMIK